MRIALAESDEDVARCFAVMLQLRPSLTRETFVARIRGLQQTGYQLAFLEDHGTVQAVAGYRIGDMLARGRHMYVDDLVTDTASRSKGYGAKLLRWLAERAREAGCRELHLDSGVQRTGAHRFYEREGMELASYHFRLRLR
jgi:GNAT superfamily N-acetyltransferase